MLHPANFTCVLYCWSITGTIPATLPHHLKQWIFCLQNEQVLRNECSHTNTCIINVWKLNLHSFRRFVLVLHKTTKHVRFKPGEATMPGYSPVTLKWLRTTCKILIKIKYPYTSKAVICFNEHFIKRTPLWYGLVTSTKSKFSQTSSCY